MLEHASECLKMLQTASNCFKMLQNALLHQYPTNSPPVLHQSPINTPPILHQYSTQTSHQYQRPNKSENVLDDRTQSVFFRRSADGPTHFLTDAVCVVFAMHVPHAIGRRRRWERRRSCPGQGTSPHCKKNTMNNG